MQGRIVKGIAGFYYVDTEDGVFECRAKGIFRNQKVKPLVGDLVELEVLSQEEKEGSVISIFPRKSELIRPAVANVDQALVIFALSRPTPNLPLLDRFLIMMKQKEIPTIMCFNKSDMVSEEEREHFRQIYRDCGSKLLFISAKKGEGTDAVRDCLRGHMTTVAGPSGVGSIIWCRKQRWRPERSAKKRIEENILPVTANCFGLKKTVTFWILRASLHWSRKLWRKKNCGSAFRNLIPMRAAASFKAVFMTGSLAVQ